MTKKTLRLRYPQWQGGIISQWVPELAPDDASLNYALGCRLLDFLAPVNADQKTVSVPVVMDPADREERFGISSFEAIKKQTQAALKILEIEDPDRIITLGGDCSVSAVPFTYLARKFGEENVAIVWIDAHPDINRPGDQYTGYHAMALGACLGLAGEEIAALLPAKISAKRAFLAGLHAWEKDGGTKERQQEYGLLHASPEDLRRDPKLVLNWLDKLGSPKVLVHFDLDVLDPKEIISAVGVFDGGMYISETVSLINAISENFDLAALTIAEPMPRTAKLIENLLGALKILKG